jgi:dienelactone hydrolase
VGIGRAIRILGSMGAVAIALALPLWQRELQAQRSSFSVNGLSLNSDALQNSLALPFWRTLATAPCAPVQWRADLKGTDAFATSTRPLRDRLIQVTGPLYPSAGSVIESVTVFRGPRYTIDRVLVTSRIPNAKSFAYVVRQTQMRRKTPAVVLLHGSRMEPLEAFGWNVSGSYRPEERPKNASFVSAALEFAEAGYTVYVPWFDDNSQSSTWQEFPWASLERNGAALGARVDGLGPLSFLINEVSGGVDYLETLPNVDIDQLAVAGWGEGAQIAVMAAARDHRFAAVVRLSAPADRRALRGTVDGVLGDAHFAHVDCALGDLEMATLVAPRPLLYAYSTKDESVSQIARFISLPVAGGIREVYRSLGQPNNFQVQADTTWSRADSRRVRVWVDAALRFSPRAVPSIIEVREPSAVSSDLAWRDTTRYDRESFSATLGTCVARSPTPDFRSVSAFLTSIEPFRREVARELVVPRRATAPFTVVQRTSLGKRPGYTLEFVQIRSSRIEMIISGLLALPDVQSANGIAAIVSADGNTGLGVAFGLFGRERVPYLNAYADAAASAGAAVFVPYYPFEFPEVASVELAARTGGAQSDFTYTVPIMSAAADFVLSLPQIDSTRLGIWGISFGGVAALYSAALDTRFTSLVFSDPVVTADVLFRTQFSSSLAAWWPEICATVDAVQAYLIAPRRFVRENGLRDANGFERTPIESVKRIRSVYNSLGIESQFLFVRHDGGHETRPQSVRAFLP